MLNVSGVSLSVLSHFLPLQCAGRWFFSPCFILGSDWRCMADYCLVFRKSDNGRSAMACPLPRLRLAGCEKHPKWWNERRHSSVRDGCSHCSWYADDRHDNPGKRCKQLCKGVALKTVLCSFSWPAGAEMRLYLSFQKAIFVVMLHLSNWDTVSLFHCMVTTPVQSQSRKSPSIWHFSLGK